MTTDVDVEGEKGALGVVEGILSVVYEYEHGSSEHDHDQVFWRVAVSSLLNPEIVGAVLSSTALI